MGGGGGGADEVHEQLCVTCFIQEARGAIRGANWEAEEMSGQKVRHPGQWPHRPEFSQQKWKRRQTKTHMEVRTED